MALEPKDFWEMGSDLFGALGSIAMIVPVYRLLAAREMLNRSKSAVLKHQTESATAVEDLVGEIDQADQSAAGFDQGDFDWFKRGAWAVVISFILKAIYHLVSKDF